MYCSILVEVTMYVHIYIYTHIFLCKISRSVENNFLEQVNNLQMGRFPYLHQKYCPVLNKRFATEIHQSEHEANHLRSWAIPSIAIRDATGFES